MRLMENSQLVVGIVPVDLATAANAGDWVSLKGYRRCRIIFIKGAGGGSDDPVITLNQATAVAGTGTKALSIVTEGWKKDGTQTGIGTFTKATQAAASTFTVSGAAGNQGLWTLEVEANQLDTDNDFDCLQASIADTGTFAQLGTLLYELYEPRFPQETPASAIVD